MKNCTDLYFLSTIACQLSQCLTEDELNVLSASLSALGDMIEVLLARRQTADSREEC